MSVPALSLVSNYRWEVPAGWTVTSGQGTRSVSIRVNGTPNGIVRVIPNYGFPEVERSVRNNRALLFISGNASVCLDEDVSFSTAGGATGYQWVLPSGMYLNSGQGTRTISAYVTSWFSGGTVRVTANVGGCSSSSVLSVTGRNCGSSEYMTKGSTDTINTMINARTAVENTNDVVLYPNPPERGEVNLQMQQVGNYRVEVRDSRGNLRYTREIKQLDI